MAIVASGRLSSRLISPGLRALMARRAAEMGGLALGLGGLVLLVALGSYDPRDPSFDTATVRHAGNLMGSFGATVADLLLQGFGLAGAVPAAAMIAWAWRVASHRGLGSVATRLAASLLAPLPLSAVLAGLRVGHWPVTAGPGGAVGSLIADTAFEAGRELLGPVGLALVWAVTAALAVILVVLGFGLSAGEWRAAGRLSLIHI